MSIRIKLGKGKDEEWVEVESIYERNGLAVHRLLDKDGEPTDGWNVTHLRTGLAAIQNIYKRENAVKICDYLTNGMTWDFENAPDPSWGRFQGMAWGFLRSLCVHARTEWMDEGRPEYRERVYDRLDENFDGYVIGLDAGKLIVANLRDDIVVGFDSYTLIPESGVQENERYFNDPESEPDHIEWKCEDYIAHFYVGMRLGNELDPVPFDDIFDLDEDEAHTWAHACSGEDLSYCSRCDTYFDSQYHGHYIEDWGDVICDSCFEYCVDEGSLCREHGCENCDDCRDECEEDEHGECNEICCNPPGNEPRFDNSMAMRGNDERAEKASKNSREWDNMSHNEKKATLDVRINTTLAECNPNLPMYKTE